MTHAEIYMLYIAGLMAISAAYALGVNRGRKQGRREALCAWCAAERGEDPPAGRRTRFATDTHGRFWGKRNAVD